MYDRELSFNGEGWHKVLPSQEDLFQPDLLRKIGDMFSREFHHGVDGFIEEDRPYRTSGEALPVIPEHAINPEFSSHLCSRTTGYDLPCLVSGNRQASRNIMLCAQDPLRGKSDPFGVSVATFFGINNPRHRENNRHYGILWTLIKRLIEQDFNVWLTDARKLWFCPSSPMQSIQDLQSDILRKEIDIVDPDRIVALGNQSFSALAEILKGTPRVNRLKKIHHPAWRGLPRHLKKNEGFVYSAPEINREKIADWYFRQISPMST